MAMNWTTLKADIAEYIDRSTDTALINRIPTLIELAEFDIARSMKPRGFEVYTTGTFTGSQNTITQPTRFKAPISFAVTASGGDVLKRRSFSFIQHYRRNLTAAEGMPVFYATRNDKLVMAPTPDSNYAYELLYFERLEPLGAANLTNWLTDNAPDLLLYATLLQAAPYLKNDPRIAMWSQAYNSLASSVMLEESKYREDEAVQ